MMGTNREMVPHKTEETGALPTERAHNGGDDMGRFVSNILSVPTATGWSRVGDRREEHPRQPSLCRKKSAPDKEMPPSGASGRRPSTSGTGTSTRPSRH